MLLLTRFAMGIPTASRCFIKTEGTILHSKIPLCMAMPLAISILISLPAAARAADLTDPFLKSFAAPNRSLETDDRPNVLLIMVDDLNVAIGAYLDATARPQYRTAKTPNIDRLAATGIRFHQAFVQNPICSPSRASFLSGLRPETTDIYDNRTPYRQKMGEELRLMPEHFHDQGYFTARVGKIGHNSGEDAISWDVSMFALSREPGARFHLPGYLPGVDLSKVRDNTWTEGSRLGMTRAQLLTSVGRRGGLPLSWRATNESPRMTPDGTTVTRVINLLAQNRDKPFFIAAGFHKPHQPWVGPAEFFAQHPVDEVQLPRTPDNDTDDIPEPAGQITEDDANHTDRQKKQAIAAYHAMVTMIDSYVGQLLDALELLELADSTVVVFTSDHGFQLNEHGGLWRKSVQFEESTRVPLIVRLPDGRNAGQVANGLVELVDVYPSLIDLAKLPVPAHALEGLSFAPLLENPELQWKSAIFSEYKREGYHGRTLRSHRYRYTEWVPLVEGDGGTLLELYDLDLDPFEFDNIALDVSSQTTIANLSEQLKAGWPMALPTSRDER